jgi:hypothetical protein
MHSGGVSRLVLPDSNGNVGRSAHLGSRDNGVCLIFPCEISLEELPPVEPPSGDATPPEIEEDLKSVVEEFQRSSERGTMGK